MKNVQIINKIIEIEAQAQELIKNAEQEHSDLPVKIAEIIEEHKKEYHDKALARIESVRVKEDEISKEKISKLLEENKAKLDRLKQMVDENIDEWIDKIYNYIIQPTDI